MTVEVFPGPFRCPCCGDAIPPDMEPFWLLKEIFYCSMECAKGASGRLLS